MITLKIRSLSGKLGCMKKELIVTGDGSTSLRIPEWDEQYHSKHGAIREAEYVFILQGLEYYISTFGNKEPLNILEIGFGTGLNALLTIKYAIDNNLSIDYKGLEAYPVSPDFISKLNYTEKISGQEIEAIFEKLHDIPWKEKNRINPNFSLTKEEKFFQDFSEENSFDIVYFDAFGARVQPELWEPPILEKMHAALRPNGVFVTYSAKGSVRRALKALDFDVDKIPGPPGKREMLRAVKS